MGGILIKEHWLLFHCRVKTDNSFSGQYVRCEVYGETDRVLERQTELSGQYEEEEKAQGEWEKQCNENKNTNKVCCVGWGRNAWVDMLICKALWSLLDRLWPQPLGQIEMKCSGLSFVCC